GEAIAPPLQEPAEDALGLAVVVGVGRVEERDAPLGGVREDALRLGGGRALAEVHAAEGEGDRGAGRAGSEQRGHGPNVARITHATGRFRRRASLPASRRRPGRAPRGGAARSSAAWGARGAASRRAPRGCGSTR